MRAQLARVGAPEGVTIVAHGGHWHSLANSLRCKERPQLRADRPLRARALDA